RNVVRIPERCNVRCLRITNNAVAAETVKAVVILEHDYEHVIKPRDAALFLTLVVLALVILGPRRRHTYCERQSDCQCEQMSFHPTSFFAERASFHRTRQSSGDVTRMKSR